MRFRRTRAGVDEWEGMTSTALEEYAAKQREEIEEVLVRGGHCPREHGRHSGRVCPLCGARLLLREARLTLTGRRATYFWTLACGSLSVVVLGWVISTWPISLRASCVGLGVIGLVSLGIWWVVCWHGSWTVDDELESFAHFADELLKMRDAVTEVAECDRARIERKTSAPEE